MLMMSRMYFFLYIHLLYAALIYEPLIPSLNVK